MQFELERDMRDERGGMSEREREEGGIEREGTCAMRVCILDIFVVIIIFYLIYNFFFVI